MEGIDVSQHNGNIALSNYQNGFVIIRVSWDVDQLDTKAVRNMNLCEELNIPYGVYVYSYALEPTAAVKEAEFALKQIKGRNIQLGVWFDMEDADGWKMRHGFDFSKENITNICNAFCKKVADAGYYTGIYASYSWFYDSKAKSGYIDCPNYDKWVAHWGENDGTYSVDLSSYGASLHQYTSHPLDKDVMYVDFRNLANPQ